jgi:kynurenine formamidase
MVGLGMTCAAGAAGGREGSSTPKKLTKSDIDDMMKSLSNWGRWGKNDQLGALNLITPKKRRQAAALVKEGIVVSLAHNVIKKRTAASAPFVQKMVALPKKGEEITWCGDEYSVQYHGYTQTHLDALCHLAYKGRLYNGFSQEEITAAGAGKLGVQHFKEGIVTRGVLMDMPRLFETRFLTGAHAVTPKDLEAWEKKAGVTVESGDAVLIRTGRWIRGQLASDREIVQNSGGLHASCLPWLKRREVAVVGSDLALDVMPSRVEGFAQPVHWVLIVAMGTPILDNCDLEKLSEEANARKRWAFLLTVAPLVVEGGTGSPVNPLGMF